MLLLALVVAGFTDPNKVDVVDVVVVAVSVVLNLKLENSPAILEAFEGGLILPKSPVPCAMIAVEVSGLGGSVVSAVVESTI